MKILTKIISETNWNIDNESRNNSNHLHDKLTNHYSFRDLDEKEKNSVDNYTTDSSHINNYLWKSHKGERMDHSEDYYNNKNETIDHLDSVLDKRKTPHKLSVYSGTSRNPKDVMNEKGEVNHPAFLSTTINHPIAKNFANTTFPDNLRENSYKHILKINVPKGHSGAYVDHLSANPGEREFILPRNTKMKYRGTVIHKKEKTGEDYDVHEHSMDVI